MEAKQSADEFKHGIKNDSSVKGAEAMLMPEQKIHENSVESEIICDPSEHYQDLSSGDAFKKRMQINGAQLNSSEKQEHDKWQQIYGLESENEDEDGLSAESND